MTDSLFDVLLDQLREHEGLSLKPYEDTYYYLNIGYGRNLTANGISKTEAEFLLSNDARNAIEEARQIFENFNNLSINRQSVIANMIFNLGLDKFNDFHHFIEAVKNGNFTLASQEMLNSEWAEQVKTRATYLADLMEKG